MFSNIYLRIGMICKIIIICNIYITQMTSGYGNNYCPMTSGYGKPPLKMTIQWLRQEQRHLPMTSKSLGTEIVTKPRHLFSAVNTDKWRADHSAKHGQHWVHVHRMYSITCRINKGSSSSWRITKPLHTNGSSFISPLPPLQVQTAQTLSAE